MADSLSAERPSGKIAATQPPLADRMTVIPFRRPPSRRQFTPPVEPPAALAGSAAAPSRSSADAAEDRRRMQQNLAVLALVVVLLALGTWMIDRLIAYSRAMACIESGHRSCMKLKVDQVPR
jgi:hypothetical protein